jgi:hypothetical protein
MYYSGISVRVVSSSVIKFRKRSAVIRISFLPWQLKRRWKLVFRSQHGLRSANVTTNRVSLVHTPIIIALTQALWEPSTLPSGSYRTS